MKKLKLGVYSSIKKEQTKSKRPRKKTKKRIARKYKNTMALFDLGK